MKTIYCGFCDTTLDEQEIVQHIRQEHVICDCRNCQDMPPGMYCNSYGACGWCKGAPKKELEKGDWKKYVFPLAIF